MRPSTRNEEGRGRERDIKIFAPFLPPSVLPRIGSEDLWGRISDSFCPLSLYLSLCVSSFPPLSFQKLFSIPQKPNPREARALISSTHFSDFSLPPLSGCNISPHFIGDLAWITFLESLSQLFFCEAGRQPGVRSFSWIQFQFL